MSSSTDYLTGGPVRGSARALRALWVAVVALLVTAVFGLASVADESPSDSPEVAVRRLLTAADKSDVLGALQALLPSERDALRQPLLDLLAEAKRLGLAGDGVDLERLDGLSLDFDDVKTSARNLTADVAVVTLEGGKVTALFDGRRLAGPLLREVGVDVDAAVTEEETTDLSDDDPARLVAIREGGKWYVSIGYSIAEEMRNEAGGAVPDFGHELEAKGEATPEAAVEAALKAFLAGDFEHLVALVGSAEGRVLRDYAPLYLPDAKGALPFSGKVRKLTTAVSGRSGSAAKVAIKTFDLDITFDGETGRFAYDGKCATITAPGSRPQRNCDGDATKALPIIGQLTDSSAPTELTFAVVSENGQWFLSPTRTVADLLLTMTKALDRNTLKEIVESFQEGTIA